MYVGSNVVIQRNRHGYCEQDGLHLTITFSSTNSTLPFQSRVQHAFCFQFFLFDDDGIEHAQSIISCPLLKRYLLEDNVFGLTAL